jgi:hypothetical protein
MGAVVATSEMTPFFKGQMRRLLGLKFAPVDMTTHWEVLKGVPDAVLVSAVARAQAECRDFPSPSELLSFADQVRRAEPLPQEPDRGVDLIAPVVIGALPTGTVIKAKREWRYYCDDCQDSGWLSIWCGDTAQAKPWQSHGNCGRTREHGSHEFVTPCPCASSNPDVLRRKERDRQGGKRGSSE